MQRFGQSVAGTIMTVHTTNGHDNSVCPYFSPIFPIFPAEACALDGLDAVADGDDDIEVVMVYVPGDGPVPLGLNLCKFCTCCPRFQLPLPKRIPDVLGDDRSLTPKQLAHLLLSQPHRLAIEPHIHANLAICGLVDAHLAARGFDGCAHAVAS